MKRDWNVSSLTATSKPTELLFFNFFAEGPPTLSFFGFGAIDDYRLLFLLFSGSASLFDG
jgi:hypothetical protein